jgi:hypothetical protein
VRLPELWSSAFSGNDAVQKHCSGILRLDNAFVLIEGHPKKPNQSLGVDVLEWYHPTAQVCQKKQREWVVHLPLNSTATWSFGGKSIDGGSSRCGR